MTEYETFVPLMKKSLGFEELKKNVVDSGICSGCGGCAAFCDRIEVNENGARLIKDCTLTAGSIKCSENGTCYDNCPMLSFSWSKLEEEVFGSPRQDAVLGYYKKILSVKSKKKEILDIAQDGGAVTSLLACALDNKIVNAAAVTTKSEYWNPEPVIALDRESLLKAGGTKYSRAITPATFGKNLRNYRRLAVVGTGCQISAVRRFQSTLLKEVFQKTKESEIPLNVILIGLFCYENFPYTKFMERIEAEFGIRMEEIAKTDIIKGKVIVTKKNGEKVEKHVKVFNEIVPESCKLCPDFTAGFADISVGSVGSDAGWSTVIIRSDKGMALFEKAREQGYIEVKEVANIEEIKKTATSKDKKREATREARMKEGRYVPNYA